jgi:hypothetical protein
MKITLEKLESLNPCTEGLRWYKENIKTENLLDVLEQINQHNSSWARWLFTRLMTKDQCVEIAIFLAELVLNVFEDKYPKDDRPRKAIEAAKEYLKTKTPAAAATAAATAAYAAAYAAAAATAAYAAAYAAYAGIKITIIKKAVEILEKTKE